MSQVENAWAGQGAVLLDIGGDVGAVVVTMPATSVGVEVEVRAHGVAPGLHHPHVAVVDRPVAGGSQPSLVYPALREGRYDLVVVGTDEVVATVDVDGGRVTQLDWPQTASDRG